MLSLEMEFCYMNRWETLDVPLILEMLDFRRGISINE